MKLQEESKVIEIQKNEYLRLLRLLEDIMDDTSFNNDEAYDSAMEAYGILAEYVE